MFLSLMVNTFGVLDCILHKKLFGPIVLVNLLILAVTVDIIN